MKQVTAILLGAGQRGADVYAEYALQFPNELKIITVAEPRADRREAFAQQHKISPENVTQTWEPLLEREKFADCVLVCTQDRMHVEPVMIALEKGYDVLCEKPMSGDKRELIAMGAKAKETGRVLSIAHTLRYSPFFMKLKELLDGGAIGQLCAIQHMESVGYWHMAHSFVRGNWRREDETSPMILQKCCTTWMSCPGWLALLWRPSAASAACPTSALPISRKVLPNIAWMAVSIGMLAPTTHPVSTWSIPKLWKMDSRRFLPWIPPVRVCCRRWKKVLTAAAFTAVTTRLLTIRL